MALKNNIAGDLIKSYSPLLNVIELKRLTSILLDDNTLSKFTRNDILKYLNKYLFNNYSGELIAKYNLVNKYLKENSVCGFELKIDNSRVDFFRINGSSYGYEIKSELDTLSKLMKQCKQNSKIFDYNNIVIDKSHFEEVVKIIPDDWGIIFFDNFSIKTHKKPQPNHNIDSKDQLKILSVNELLRFFKTSNISEILKFFGKNEINIMFKLILKEKYKKNWDFLSNNINNILPLDYQFFYRKNINPEIIYS